MISKYYCIELRINSPIPIYILYIIVKPHMNKFTCFLLPPGGGSPLGGSDSLSTIGPDLSHLTAVKPPGPRTG